MSKLPNPAQPPSIMQAYELARVPQKRAKKWASCPNPAQPPAIMQADGLARVPQKRAHKN